MASALPKPAEQTGVGNWALHLVDEILDDNDDKARPGEVVTPTPSHVPTPAVTPARQHGPASSAPAPSPTPAKQTPSKSDDKPKTPTSSTPAPASSTISGGKDKENALDKIPVVGQVLGMLGL